MTQNFTLLDFSQEGEPELNRSSAPYIQCLELSTLAAISASYAQASVIAERFPDIAELSGKAAIQVERALRAAPELLEAVIQLRAALANAQNYSKFFTGNKTQEEVALRKAEEAFRLYSGDTPLPPPSPRTPTPVYKQIAPEGSYCKDS